MTFRSIRRGAGLVAAAALCLAASARSAAAADARPATAPAMSPGIRALPTGRGAPNVVVRQQNNLEWLAEHGTHQPLSADHGFSSIAVKRVSGQKSVVVGDGLGGVAGGTYLLDPTTGKPIAGAEKFNAIDVKKGLVLGTKWGEYNHLLDTYEHKTFVLNPATGRAMGARPFHEIDRSKDGAIVGVTVPDASNNRYSYVLDAKGKAITPVFEAIRNETPAVSVGTQKGLQWLVDPATKRVLSTEHAFSFIRTARVDGESTVVVGASLHGAIGDFVLSPKTGKPIAGAEKFDRLEAEDGLLVGTHRTGEYNPKLGTYDRNLFLVNPATGRATGRPFQQIYRDKTSGKIIGVEVPLWGESHRYELDGKGNAVARLRDAAK